MNWVRVQQVYAVSPAQYSKVDLPPKTHALARQLTAADPPLDMLMSPPSPWRPS